MILKASHETKSSRFPLRDLIRIVAESVSFSIFLIIFTENEMLMHSATRRIVVPSGMREHFDEYAGFSTIRSS